MSSQCECDTCASACRSPGALMPDDVVPIAEFLHSSPMQLMSTKLQKDVGSNMIRPVVHRGWCVFHLKGKCTIHAVKPFECREYMHGDSTFLIQLRSLYIDAKWSSEIDDNRRDENNAFA